MPSPMTDSAANVMPSPKSGSRFDRAISMISVLRMRSVRIAPKTSFFSPRASSSSLSWCAPNHSSTFSAPS